MLFAAIDPTTLLVAIVAAVAGFAGVGMQVRSQARDREEKREEARKREHAEAVAAAAARDADNVREVLDGWKEQVVSLNGQMADLRTRLTQSEVSNAKCHEERGALQLRVADLERTPR